MTDWNEYPKHKDCDECRTAGRMAIAVARPESPTSLAVWEVEGIQHGCAVIKKANDINEPTA